jgi:protein-tyrosine-phosphatase
MAMALMRKRVKDLHLDEMWIIDSAGTSGFDGIPATHYSVKAVQEWGIALKDHQSRRVSEEILRQYDLILTMERRHKEELQAGFPGHTERIYLLSEMVGGGWDVLDPIGRPAEEYSKTASRIDLILEEGMETILSTARRNASRSGMEEDNDL